MKNHRYAMIAGFAAAAIIAVAFVAPAYAGNTTFLTDKNGNVVFPFSPPNRSASTPGLIDNTTIGATTPAPATITNLVVTGTVSGASLNSLTSPGPIGSVAPGSGAFTTLTASGQITTTAGLPTIASGACGTTTNGAVVAGSTNQAGRITIGSVATTSCTISWSATLGSAPKACVFMAMNAGAIAATTLPYVGIPSTTAVVLNGAVLASTNWGYICL